MGRTHRPEEIERHQQAACGSEEHQKGGREQRLTLLGARVLVIGSAGRMEAIGVPTETFLADDVPPPV